MGDRLEDLEKRLKGLDETGQLVGALRAIASGRSTEARAAAAAVRLYAATVQGALASVLVGATLPAHPRGPGQLLVIGAAQGFSGAYPARITAAVQEARIAGQDLFVIGRRSQALLEEAGLSVVWSDDLPGHVAAVPELASRVTDALLERQEAHPGPISVVVARDQADLAVECQPLFPPAAPSAATAAMPPLVTLSSDALISGLLAEALFAAVVAALMQGIAAEAQARVQAMARAQNNLKSRHADIERASQLARQEKTTTEMIEIAGARGASSRGAV